MRFGHRILGGLGCTMDVLLVTERGATGSKGEFKVVLRRRGSWSRDDNIDAAHTELEVLQLLRSESVPVPEPLWLDDDGVFAEPATLIEFIDGAPLLSPEDPIDYTTQMAQMLVRLHDVSLDSGLRRKLRDYNALERSLLADVDAPENVAGHHLGARLWAEQRAESRKIVPEDGKEGDFVHGDYWPGNTLWQGQKLVAVVDFEEIGIGDPVMDVAAAVVNYRFESWRDAERNFLEVYRGETGRQLDSFRFWALRELRRPMPDVARWLPSFQQIGSGSVMTVEKLRAAHADLILELLQ